MRKLYKYPWLIVVIITLITVLFAFQLPRAELENNNLRFVPTNDPALETSRWIDDTFGSSFFILIGLERQYGTIFDSGFLNLIRDYIQTVEEIPIVKETTSLINADYITSEGDAIVVEKLVSDDFSGTPEEIAELKRRLLSWEMYDRALFSDDFTATQILIPLTIKADESTTKEETEQFIRIRDIARETFADSATVYVTGMPIIVATINETMNADLKLLVPMVVLLVLAVLFFSLRGVTPVVLPLLTVVIATIWSVGAMPVFGIKLSVISTVLPVILTAVGSAYGIHIVTHYLADYKAGIGRNASAGCGPVTMTNGSFMSRDEHSELVLSVMMKICKPVFLAALTTFVGFSSFCFTSVAPCREFGYFASFGVAAAFIVAVALIPSLLIIRGPRPFRRVKSGASGENGNKGTALADSLENIARHKKTICFITVLVGVVSLYGLSKLIIDNVMVEYFRDDTDIYKSDGFIRRQFGGSKIISVVVEADSYEKILRPDTLTAMDGLSGYLQRKVPETGKVMGFTDLVKRINQVFNADESPEGLSPVDFYGNSSHRGASNFSSPNLEFAYAEDLGFGFDDSDDFGFGFGGLDNTEQAALPGLQSPIPDPSREKTYTQEEMLSLFDRAGSFSRNMNANDLIWELKRQINYEGASYYEIPADPERYGKKNSGELGMLISNYLVLLSGSIEDYANDPLEPTAIKSTIQMRTLGMNDSGTVFREIEKYIAANFPFDDVTVTLGGSTMVERSLNRLVMQSQLVSMLFSLICVFIIIAVSNKSFVAGCIGIAPLSLSILINFAIMGFTGIKLNLGTSMVAGISVGVGIDYTIHCLEAYKREYRASNGTGNFLWRTFNSSGKAIIINAVSVGVGFAVLLFSRFIMLADLGLLIAITMFSSALVSLTVLPALLAVFKPKFVARDRDLFKSP